MLAISSRGGGNGRSKPLTRCVPAFWFLSPPVLCSDSSGITVVPPPQVLAKNADNVKAKFRKGKALGELGHFEKATTILEDLLKAGEKGQGELFVRGWCGGWDSRPVLDAPAIKAELQRFKVMEREVTKKADSKMRGLFVENRIPRH